MSSGGLSTATMGLGAIAMLLTLAAATAEPVIEPVMDRHATPQSPRIVSLAPHLTELAFAAGIGDTLVGVVEWSDYPAEAESLPRIGDAFRFDLERIVRLEASHALAWGGGTPAAAVAELETLGVEVEVIEIETLAQIGAAMERLGVLGGSPETARAAAAAFRARLSGFRGSGPGTRHESREKRVSLFYQVSETPLFTLGGTHVINEVFELCGSFNVFSSLDTRATNVDLEAVLTRDPLAMVIGAEGPADKATRWHSYPDLRAVACDNILFVDPALLVRPTPRLLDGAARLCTWLDRKVRQADTPACSTGRD